MKKVDKSSFAGTKDDSSTNVQVEQVSQPIAKPDVGRSLSISSKIGFVYETEKEDVMLETDEEQIMKAMRKLNGLWKKYKSKANGNRLILFCGGTGCDIRFETPSADNVLENYEHITCEGGDGGDHF